MTALPAVLRSRLAAIGLVAILLLPALLAPAVGAQAGFVIETIAGSGPPDLGDGRPARTGFLEQPLGLAVDRNDNVYVIDNTRRIRRIDGQTGRIQSVFISADPIWSIEFDQDDWGYLTESTRIRRFHPANASAIEVVAGGDEAGFAGDGGPAIEAKLRGSQFLSFDARGDIYFPDNGNFRIRRLRRP